MNRTIVLLITLFSLSVWGQEEKKYGLGDIYNENGVHGIVVQVKDNGRHGLIMSLDEGEEAWCRNPFYFRMVTSATNSNDGMCNMQIIAELINLYGLSWDYFPAFQWCRNKGEGWYLPAINELVIINMAYHGGRIEINKAAQSAFNKILTENGGLPLRKMRYLSSTEITGEKIYAIYFEKGLFAYGLECDKCKDYIRAVRKF